MLTYQKAMGMNWLICGDNVQCAEEGNSNRFGTSGK